MKRIKSSHPRAIGLIALLILLLPFGLMAQSRQEVRNTALPPDLDNYISKVLEAFDVPGVGVAIVKDGEILLTKGYGIKRLGQPDPVDENTIFSIASNSKAFAATSLALLVEQGKLNWEDRVIKHLPWFAMSDDYVTQNLTVRDLLVHHSGLPAYANDILNFPLPKCPGRNCL